MSTAGRRRARRATALALVACLALAGCSDDQVPEGTPDGAASASASPGILDRALEAQVSGDPAAAESLWRQLLAEEPENKFALYNLGLIAQQSGDDAEAVDLYTRTLEVDPAYAPALYNLAILTDEGGNEQSAINLYARAVEADPDNAAARFNLGLLLRSNGREEEGLREINAALEIDPSLGSRLPSGTPSPTS